METTLPFPEQERVMLARGISGLSRRGVIAHPRYRAFHQTPTQWKAISFLLADIGEGITEVEVIQWYGKWAHRMLSFKTL